MDLMTQTRPVHVPSMTFEDLVTRVAFELQSATGDLVASLPGPVRRAVDLERTLHLERKLAWQVFRLSRSSSLSELANVPSLPSALRVIDAGRAQGVPEPIVQRVRAAFERFENLAVDHCGDRAGMLSMVTGLTHGRSEGVELRVRKGLFRGNAHVWGIRADRQVRTLIYEPGGPGEETLRAVLISGNLGLQGLRRSEPLVISSWLSVSPVQSGNLAHAAPASTPKFELLPQFCSPNLPEVSHVPNKLGMVEAEMLIPVTGRTGALSLYLTQSSPTAGDARTAGAGAGMFISVPAAEVVNELLVPAGYTSPATARVALFGRRHHPERAGEERTYDLLPQSVPVTYLGRSTRAAPIDGVPRHAEVVQHVLERDRLLGREFDIYRCRVRYPVLHTFVVLRVDGVGST